MKRVKHSNLPKLVAFFLVVGVLTCTVAYAASGWNYDILNSTLNNDNTNSDKTDSSDKNDDDNTDVPVVLPIPEYLHYITGMEISPDRANDLPLCFVFDSAINAYSMSTSFLTFEIPTENGRTRLLSFTDDALTLGKIGSIAPTRDSISTIASIFGGVIVCDGNDGNMSDSSASYAYPSLDIKKNTGYHYTEYGNRLYTNSDLIRALIKNTDTPTQADTKPLAPYIFNGYYDEKISYLEAALTVEIGYGEANRSQFIFSNETRRYVLSKNGQVITDPINDKCCSYDNVFILYVDSTTYENAEFTESVIDLPSGGTGIYATCGTYTEINWSISEDGNMLFTDNNGNTLTVNRGSSFISFVKSSNMNSVSFS